VGTEGFEPSTKRLSVHIHLSYNPSSKYIMICTLTAGITGKGGTWRIKPTDAESAVRPALCVISHERVSYLNLLDDSRMRDNLG